MCMELVWKLKSTYLLTFGEARFLLKKTKAMIKIVIEIAITMARINVTTEIATVDDRLDWSVQFTFVLPS